MSTIPDDRYAQQLLDILANDRCRMQQDPSHAPVVLWMVEELRAAAARLTLDRPTSQSMLTAAAEALRDATETRRRQRQAKKKRRAA